MEVPAAPGRRHSAPDSADGDRPIHSVVTPMFDGKHRTTLHRAESMCFQMGTWTASMLIAVCGATINGTHVDAKAFGRQGTGSIVGCITYNSYSSPEQRPDEPFPGVTVDVSAGASHHVVFS